MRAYLLPEPVDQARRCVCGDDLRPGDIPCWNDGDEWQCWNCEEVYPTTTEPARMYGRMGQHEKPICDKCVDLVECPDCHGEGRVWLGHLGIDQPCPRGCVCN